MDTDAPEYCMVPVVPDHMRRLRSSICAPVYKVQMSGAVKVELLSRWRERERHSVSSTPCLGQVKIERVGTRATTGCCGVVCDRYIPSNERMGPRDSVCAINRDVPDRRSEEPSQNSKQSAMNRRCTPTHADRPQKDSVLCPSGADSQDTVEAAPMEYAGCRTDADASDCIDSCVTTRDEYRCVQGTSASTVAYDRPDDGLNVHLLQS